jgi:hypothetical protein
MTTHYDDLLAGLDAPSAESLWSADDPAKPGDTVAGKIIAVSHRDTEYGTKPILTLRVGIYLRDVKGKATEQKQYADQTIAVHCYNGILASKIDELQVRAGGEIAIRYDGERTGAKSGKTYKAWTVRYKAPAPGQALVESLDHDDEEPF